MTSTSRRNKRIKYFSRSQHCQKQQQSKQNQNLDNALANAVNNMYISQTNFVQREWYEKLWRDFKDLDRDYGNLNIRFKFGLIVNADRGSEEINLDALKIFFMYYNILIFFLLFGFALIYISK
ncbi:unnamed protein product [Rhizophagus irregularis]|nr:unnamed protein product [Rhizophagus irregularis]